MKAYGECYPDQSKKFYLIHNFIEQSQKFKDSGKILAGLASEFHQGILILRYQAWAFSCPSQPRRGHIVPSLLTLSSNPTDIKFSM